MKDGLRARLAMAGGLVGVVVWLMLALPGSAAAIVLNNTWSGAAANGASASNWSNTSNWVGNAAPTGSDSLTFPSLSGNSSCATPSPTLVCYQSNNDITGLTPYAVTVDDTSPYNISGDGITIGAGGISTTSDNTSSYSGSPSLNLPIALGANQSWTIGGGPTTPGNGPSGYVYVGPLVTGSTYTLGVNLPNGSIDLNQGTDIGPLSFTSTGGSAGSPGIVTLGQPAVGTPTSATLNGTDDNPVSFTGTDMTALASSDTTGPLTMSGGTITVGNPGYPAILRVSGTADLGSANGLNLFITGTGTPPVAGTDYTQFTASGNTTLGGALQVMDDDRNTGVCAPLTVGDTYTLASTTNGGTLSGQFSNAPDNQVFQANCYGGTPPSFRINYTPTSVNATVVAPGSSTVSTTTALSHSPQSPAAGQSTTLTANVTGADGGTPDGTVAFTDNGNQISGCGSQAIDPNSGNATCQTSFGSGTHNLVATYSPGSGSYYNGSSGKDTVTIAAPPPSTPPAPTATTQAANPVATTTATLNGLVDTKGQAVTWQFQYGEDTSYNKATPIQTIAAGNSNPVPVSWNLLNLNPLTVYHFRLVAITQPGSGQTPLTGDGQDLSFITRSTGDLLLSFSSLKVRGNSAMIPLKCSSKLKCAGRFSITTKAKVGKKKKLASVLCDTTFFTIKAAKTTKVKARMYGACMTLMRHARGHRIKAQFTSRPRTGQFGLIRNITLIL